MSRNMIEANQYIFARLKEFIDQQDDDREFQYYGAEYPRCIETNKEDKKWLKNLEIIVKKEISSRIRFAFFKYENSFYFVSVGIFSNDVNSDILEEYDRDNLGIPGIITALIYELKIGVNKDSNFLLIYNDIFYPIEPKKIEKYNCDIVSKFFEPIKIYRMADDCALIDHKNFDDDNTLFRVSLFFLSILASDNVSGSNSIKVLDFETDTLKSFRRICLEGHISISYENLFYSFVSFSWRHSFLDIYRCIERLFSVPFWLKFYQDIYNNSDTEKKSFQDFMASLKENTGWKPIEENALGKLFEELSGSTYEPLKSVRENKSEKDFKFIYNLRNSIVHFGPDHKGINLNDQDWNTIIKVCLDIVRELYGKYKDYL